MITEDPWNIFEPQNAALKLHGFSFFFFFFFGSLEIRPLKLRNHGSVGFLTWNKEAFWEVNTSVFNQLPIKNSVWKIEIGQSLIVSYWTFKLCSLQDILPLACIPLTGVCYLSWCFQADSMFIWLGLTGMFI